MATTEQWTYQREDTDVDGEVVTPTYLILHGDALVAEAYSEDMARLIVDAVNSKLAATEDSTPQTRRSLRELEGLGKELWRSIDSTAYLTEERNAWDG